MDRSGNIIWEQTYGDSDYSEEGYAMRQNADGTFVITGSSYSSASRIASILLLKIDQNGNQVWLKKSGATMTGAGANIIKDTDGGNLITGYLHEDQIFFTKTDTDGNNSIFQ